MDKTNELFELMTKLYSEMQDMKSEMQDMKSDMNDMKSEIKDMKFEQNKTNERLDSLQNDMNSGFSEVNTRIDNLSNGIGDLITNEVSDEISKQLKTIKSDIKFIKHKVQDTEEDVFAIQDHLKLIK